MAMARSSRRGAQVLGLSAALAAASLAAQALWARVAAPASVLAVVVLAALFVVADRFLVSFPVRRGAHTLSVSEIPLVIGLFALPPPLLMLARFAGGVVGLAVLRRQRGTKLCFNLALYLTQATVAGSVFHLIAGRPDPVDLRCWAGAYAATFAADLVSIVAITAVIAIHDDSQEWRRLLSTDIRRLFQLPIVAVTTTLGLVTAIVVRERWLAAVLLGVLVLAIHRVFQRYAQQTQGHAQVEALYRFTRTLSGLPDADQVARVVLSEVRDLVRAEWAELLLRTGPAVVRLRLAGPDHFTVTAAQDDWPAAWQPAWDGAPVLQAGTRARPASAELRDTMAVPVALDDAAAVLAVGDSLPERPTFTSEQLRLMEALAAHAGVALTNARLVDRLRHIGLHDSLTDLPNRRGLLDDLRQALADLSGSSGVVGVLLLDLDRFKEINDALGHTVGDRVLREVGARLRDRFDGRATVARLGGDEFALVVPRAAGEQEVLALAGELRATVEELIEVGELALTTPASIGVCFAPQHGTDPDQLLQHADVAMYAAKQTHAGVRVYETADDQNTPRRLALMADLRTAIDKRLIRVVYQPKVDPASGLPVGAEALSRWLRGDGPVTPDEFIPLAERSGLIRPLTRHVLDTALAACRSWRRSGHELTVAVNLAPQLIADPTLVDEVRGLLARHDLPPSALTLEITENGIMADPEHSLTTLRALNALGVKLSVDDFGTGHSSLGRLAELPIHEVKIDKGFVQNLMTSPGGRAVTDAALHLGRALDLVVVAEGVETSVEFDYLRSRQCDVIQGYYFSRPLSDVDFTAWLAQTATRSAVPAYQDVRVAGVR